MERSISENLWIVSVKSEFKSFVEDFLKLVEIGDGGSVKGDAWVGESGNDEGFDE